MAKQKKTVRVVVHGATGRMGQRLLRLAAADADITLVGAVARQVPTDAAQLHVPWFSTTQWADVPACDVLVDFSLPQALDAVLEFCSARGCALVSGTTGLDAAQKAALDAVADTVAVLWASNFSRGVTLLQVLVAQAAAALPGWDCAILESHHKHKKDAPSGTALSLGAAAESGGAQPHYASVRAGDIVGEHLLQFASTGERIELIHRASCRDIFAIGALDAAKWLAGKRRGRYQMRDVLGLTLAALD